MYESCSSESVATKSAIVFIMKQQQKHFVIL